MHAGERVIPTEEMRPRKTTDEWRWLESTRRLQTETYGYDLVLLASSPEEFCKYASWNLLALYQEAGELGVEFAWKPWAVDEPFFNRERILEEMVDIGHFAGNLLVAMGVTDEEYVNAYRAKQFKNQRRAASGTYSARKGSLGEGSETE